MFGTFILGVVAGWAAPYAEPRIKSALEGGYLDDLDLTPGEWSLLSLALCLFVAAVLAMILADPHAVALALGAVLGISGPKLLKKYNSRKAPDYDS